MYESNPTAISPPPGNPRQWRNGRVSGCPVTGGPRTLGAPDKNDHKKFDSTFLGFLEECCNFGEKYHISGKFLGVSEKIFSYLGKIGVCPEKIFDSQNGTLTEKFLAPGGGGGEVTEVEQRGAKSGRLTEGPQRLRYATGSYNRNHCLHT
jgi:hypothetical protein